MTDEEVKEFIDTVVKNLTELSKYMEHMPPGEVAQSLASLITTGTTDHFFSVVPDKEAEKYLKSLPSIAAQIKEKTLKEEIEKG